MSSKGPARIEFSNVDRALYDLLTAKYAPTDDDQKIVEMEGRRWFAQRAEWSGMARSGFITFCEVVETAEVPS